jgi:hypothetical protein
MPVLDFKKNEWLYYDTGYHWPDCRMVVEQRSIL